MSKLNFQKLSKESRLSRQAVVNPPMKKAKSLRDAPRTPYGTTKVKRQSFSQAVNSETTFLKGKFQGTDIGKLYKRNKEYFIWILENQPTSVTAQQIINFFNKNPNKI